MKITIRRDNPAQVYILLSTLVEHMHKTKGIWAYYELQERAGQTYLFGVQEETPKTIITIQEGI